MLVESAQIHLELGAVFNRLDFYLTKDVLSIHLNLDELVVYPLSVQLAFVFHDSMSVAAQSVSQQHQGVHMLDMSHLHFENSS